MGVEYEGYKQDVGKFNSIKEYDLRHRGQDALIKDGRHHRKITGSSKSLDGLLRKLEKEAGLPKGDLVPDPIYKKYAYDSVIGKVKNYLYKSKAIENNWTRDINKYIESKGKIKLGNLLLEIVERVNDKSKDKFTGTLYLTENCSGVFEYNERLGDYVCLCCGEDYYGLSTKELEGYPQKQGSAPK